MLSSPGELPVLLWCTLALIQKVSKRYLSKALSPHWMFDDVDVTHKKTPTGVQLVSNHRKVNLFLCKFMQKLPLICYQFQKCGGFFQHHCIIWDYVYMDYQRRLLYTTQVSVLLKDPAVDTSWINMRSLRQKKGGKIWWMLQRVGSLTIPGTEGGSQYAHQWECDTEKASDWTGMTRPPGWGGWWDIHQSQACNWCGSHWRQTWRHRKQCNVASAKKKHHGFYS